MKPKTVEEAEAQFWKIAKRTAALQQALWGARRRQQRDARTCEYRIGKSASCRAIWDQFLFLRNELDYFAPLEVPEPRCSRCRRFERRRATILRLSGRVGSARHLFVRAGADLRRAERIAENRNESGYLGCGSG